MRSHEDSEDIGDDGGGKSDNRAALELSAAFREHIFALDEPVRGGKAAAAAARRPNPQAVALGVEALNYLRGRQVSPGEKRVCVCVCVSVFIKLHITTQSGPVILVILCHSH